MNLEQELLQKAVNSILHGATVSEMVDDGYGNQVLREYRVGDLRLQLVGAIAQKIVDSPEFANSIIGAIKPKIVEEMEKKIIESANWNNLPYSVKQNIENMMKEANVTMHKVEIRTEVIPIKDETKQ